MAESEPRMYELEYPSPVVNGAHSEGTTLVVALHGYADAGQAIESGARHLLAALEHRPIATFNNDELIDYRSRRPAVTIEHSEVVRIEDLSLELDVVRDSNGKSFLLLSGPEPDMRWEAFTKAVAELADRFHVDKTVCLYAAPMAVPHTRPLVITAHGNNKEATQSFFNLDSRITVPGSASLHLERTLNKKGRNVSGITAHVPHYLAASDYPEATWKLLDAVANIAQLNLPLQSLQADSERVMSQIEEQVQESGEIQAVVHALENQYDEELERYQRENPQAILPGDSDIPTGEQLGEEFERFLAGLDANPEQREDSSGTESENPFPPEDDDI